MQKTFKLSLLILIGVLLFAHNGFAQAKKKEKNQRESERKLRRSRDSVLQTLSKTDTSVNSLLQRVEKYTTTFNQINNTLSEGLDTLDIGQSLPGVAKRLNKIQAQANTKKSSTLRYLFVLRDNLDHIQDKLDDWQSSLDDIYTKLIQNQHDIIRFSNDSLLKAAPADSSLKKSLYDHRKKVWALWHKVDSINRSDLLKVNLLQDKVAVAYTKILDETDQIDSKIKRFANVALAGEFGYIWEADPQYKNFGSAVSGTITLNNTQLYYFLKNGTATHLIGLLFFIVIIVMIYKWKKTVPANEYIENLISHANYIYMQPIVSSLLITTAIVPYFYDHPPVAFLEGLFLISILLVLILVKINFQRSLFNFLFSLFWITIIACLSNLLIEITNADRFTILVLSILSIILAFTFYKKVKQEPEGHLPHTGLVLKVFITLQIVSFLLNVSGRFSLAKIVTTTAVFNLWMLVSLYFIVQIIIQGLFIQFHNKKEESSIVSLLDYDTIQKKFLNVLVTLAGLLWLFFLCQNLNIDDWVHDALDDLLNQSRTIGGASFTFGGFVIFVIVLWLSSMASKIISYLYDVSAQRENAISALKKKNRASTLLIRMGVFTTGFLLAVAASGFPLDKLTIIFSAFGVGIGFGLQNIVNNLVSGLILAFEKPIQIGDIIEVDGVSGTMREIGIRSSKISTGDGAEVIIPNGDLISHHVVNWTLSNTNRQVSLLVTTAYGVDINKVKDLLKNLLSNREDIMADPAPAVHVNNVSISAVEFKVLFWAADISTVAGLKSRVFTDIYAELDKEQIEMPSTQKDLYLHFPDGEPVLKTDNTNKEK